MDALVPARGRALHVDGGWGLGGSAGVGAFDGGLGGRLRSVKLVVDVSSAVPIPVLLRGDAVTVDMEASEEMLVG